MKRCNSCNDLLEEEDIDEETGMCEICLMEIANEELENGKENEELGE